MLTFLSKTVFNTDISSTTIHLFQWFFTQEDNIREGLSKSFDIIAASYIQ